MLLPIVNQSGERGFRIRRGDSRGVMDGDELSVCERLPRRTPARDHAPQVITKTTQEMLSLTRASARHASALKRETKYAKSRGLGWFLLRARELPLRFGSGSHNSLRRTTRSSASADGTLLRKSPNACANAR